MPDHSRYPGESGGAMAMPTPQQPSIPQATVSIPTYVQEAVSQQVTPEQMAQAQKFCKYASSALTYEDIPTAVDNLQKALRLLTTGQS